MKKEEKEVRTKGFKMMETYYQAARKLPDAERLAFWDAIAEFGFTGELKEELSGIVQICFMLVEPSLRKSVEYYMSQAAKGRKGGRGNKRRAEAEEPEDKPGESGKEPEDKPEESGKEPEDKPEESGKEPEGKPEESGKEPEGKPEESGKKPEGKLEESGKKPEQSREKPEQSRRKRNSNSNSKSNSKSKSNSNSKSESESKCKNPTAQAPRTSPSPPGGEAVPQGTSHPPRNGRFVPPTLEEVSAYCRERQNQVDPRKWYDFYASNGWRVGKNPMADWRASVRRWEETERFPRSGRWEETERFPRPGRCMGPESVREPSKEELDRRVEENQRELRALLDRVGCAQELDWCQMDEGGVTHREL